MREMVDAPVAQLDSNSFLMAPAARVQHRAVPRAFGNSAILRGVHALVGFLARGLQSQTPGVLALESPRGKRTG